MENKTSWKQWAEEYHGLPKICGEVWAEDKSCLMFVSDFQMVNWSFETQMTPSFVSHYPAFSRFWNYKSSVFSSLPKRFTGRLEHHGPRPKPVGGRRALRLGWTLWGAAGGSSQKLCAGQLRQLCHDRAFCPMAAEGGGMWRWDATRRGDGVLLSCWVLSN